MSRISILSLLCVVVSVMAEEYRLPLTTVPRHYTISLHLDPSPSSDTFPGHVSIQSDVKAVTSSIVIHQHLLNIDEISVTSGGQDLYSSHQVAENDAHFLTIHLKRQVQPGDSVNIDIAYTGSIATSWPLGLSRISYTDDGSRTRYALRTHLQTVHARAVFPCYDEPALKATFEMHVTCPSEYHTLFNTPVTSVVKMPSSDETKYSYQVTSPMSTYLVAVVVSDFDYLSNAGNPVYRKEFRSYARPNAKHLLGYSMDVGQRVLNALEDYIDHPYALEKVDNVGIGSNDGAMENWGLVTYGESVLLEDYNENNEILNKRSIASIMAHEFAHFWFGNEATPSWWEYLWLSEGFATYFAYYITDVVEPSMMMMDQFVHRVLHVMRQDSSPTVPPMNQAISGSPESTWSTFNSITYDKSACVIRMMSHILREDVMQQSLRTYIAHKANGSAVPGDLYEAMQETINQRGGLRDGAYVADVMGSWAEQAGFPLITVTRSGDSDNFSIEQRRYYRDQSASSDELWWVPLNWATATSPDYSDTYPSLLMPPVPEVTIHVPNSQPYFILNKQVTGYYRVMYDTENWAALTHLLNTNPSEVHAYNRAQILDDMTQFCTDGLLPCPTTMTLLQYLTNEEALQPWIVAERGFKQLFVLMEGSVEYSRLQKMVLQLNDKRLRNLGTVNLKNEEPVVRQKRENSISVACSAGSQDCVLRGLMQVPSKRLGRSQRGLVRGVELCATLRALSQSEVYVNWNLLWQEFTSSQLTAVSKEIMEALSCISDEVTLKLFIQRVLGGELDGSQVTYLLRGLISSSPRGAGGILDILKEKHILNTLKQKMVGRNNRGLSDILRTLGEHITTQESYDVLDEMAAQWRQDGVSVVESEALVGAQEAARINIRWIGDQRPQVEQWLRDNIH